MPGIYGFTKSDTLDLSSLRNISSEMNTYEHFIQDDLYEDNSICASRVHLGKVGEASSPHSRKNFKIWVEGESYNHLELARKFNLSNTSLANLLLEAYELKLLNKFLNELDGYFCAVIYDQDEQKIKLISDRYGMRMLYWYLNESKFVWGSELKAILACNVDTTIDRKSVKCFMDLGHLLGEETWFENIKLIKPSTVLTFDLQTKKVNQLYYWTWAEIKPSHLTFEQATDKLGKLFCKAVEKRFNPDERIGISISGGLDSRAILASIDKKYPNYAGYAFTFGIADCDDIKIAQDVVDLSNWRHEVFYFDESNWLNPRLKKIWNTDGMLDVTHMHGSEFYTIASDKIDINISGFLGDAIFSTSYQKSIYFKNRKIDIDFANHHFKGHLDLDFLDSFYNIDHCEPLLYMNRGRRFINMAIVNSLTDVEQRLPFFDNDCVELIFSLPDEYRLDNKLYSKMLLNNFPKLFSTIPWQKTGKPVGKMNYQSFFRKVSNKISRELKSVFGVRDTASFTDYKSWIKSPSVSDFLIEILDPSTAFYPQFLNQNFLKDYLEPHLKNKTIDHSHLILRAASLEIYLRHLNKRHYL